MYETSRILRGKLVAFLHYMSPKKVDMMGIAGVYIEYYTLGELEKAIAYLVSRDYVKKEVRPHPYIERETIVLYEITAEGIDVHEGSKQDVGVVAGAY